MAKTITDLENEIAILKIERDSYKRHMRIAESETALAKKELIRWYDVARAFAVIANDGKNEPEKIEYAVNAVYKLAEKLDKE